MISRLGLVIARVFRAVVPDPFVLVVLLSLLTLGLALAWGSFPDRAGQPQSLGVGAKLGLLLDAWRGNEGLWKFLAFGMQMCLMLLAGHALAASKPVAFIVARLARWPGSTAQAAALVGLVACLAALVNWGLGLIVGALLARDVGRALAARGVPTHYPLLVAAGYMGLLVWHGGLSGSAPLSMTTLDQAARVLPKAFVEQRGEQLLVGLDKTTFSTMNLVITAGSTAIVPIVLWLLAPKRPEDMTPPPPIRADAEAATEDEGRAGAIPDWLDRTPVLTLAVAVPLGWGVWRAVEARGPSAVGLSEIIALMLGLGLLMHGSLRGYAAAVERGAADCAGIVIQFPLYGGILAMLTVSGLAEAFAGWMAARASADTLPVFTFWAASVLNLFITSGGGLWGVQGPIALQSGLTLGVPAEKMVMAVAYGDQVTNMLQPFWALPLLAITGAKARDIVGYTAVVMVVVGAWVTLGLWLF